MLKFLSSNDLFIRVGRFACLFTPAVGIVWRMYTYLDTHAVESDYAVMPVMCALMAMFLALTGVAWSMRPADA